MAARFCRYRHDRSFVLASPYPLAVSAQASSHCSLNNLFNKLESAAEARPSVTRDPASHHTAARADRQPPLGAQAKTEQQETMSSQLTIRTLARSSGLWARPVSTTSIRYADNDDKSMYDKVKDKAGEMMEKAGQAFTESGKVGKQFTEDGKVGGKVEKETDTDSPLDSDGKVGHQFTSDGAVGGRVEKAAEKVRETGKEAQKEANK